MEPIGPLVRVQDVEPLQEFKVHVTFKNGVQKDIDLEIYLRGPIFEPIKEDIKLFRSVKVIENTIGWDNGASIDPDVLYYNLKPAWMAEPTEISTRRLIGRQSEAPIVAERP